MVTYEGGDHGNSSISTCSEHSFHRGAKQKVTFFLTNLHFDSRCTFSAKHIIVPNIKPIKQAQNNNFIVAQEPSVSAASKRQSKRDDKKVNAMAINKNDKSDIQAKKKLPYDKDTDRPKKYVAGLSDKEKKSHDRHLAKQGKKSDSDKSAYTQSPADKVAKTKPSVHTKKYKQMFGESDVELNEVIKGLKKKAEKSGMPYSILKLRK